MGSQKWLIASQGHDAFPVRTTGYRPAAIHSVRESIVMQLQVDASDLGINVRRRGILSDGWFRAKGIMYTKASNLPALLYCTFLSQGRWERIRNL